MAVVYKRKLTSEGTVYGSVFYDNNYITLEEGEVLSELTPKIPEIADVIVNHPETIVFWDDGTKTVVRCAEDETFDYEKGIAMACTKKLFGNTQGYYENIEPYVSRRSDVDYQTMDTHSLVEWERGRWLEEFHTEEGVWYY